jgi:hypothetical protein
MTEVCNKIQGKYNESGILSAPFQQSFMLLCVLQILEPFATIIPQYKTNILK